MTDVIRLNHGAAKFVLDLLQRFILAKRHKSRLFAEFQLSDVDQGEMVRQIPGFVSQLESLPNDQAFSMPRIFAVKFLRPIVIVMYSEIQESDRIIDSLARQHDSSLALDFVKRNIFETEDDLDFYKSHFTEREYRAISEGVKEIKEALSLNEPARSTAVDEFVHQSIAHIQVREDHCFQDCLDQLEEIAEHCRDELIIRGRYEPTVSNFLDSE